jgi:predicted Zn-dependent protease
LSDVRLAEILTMSATLPGSGAFLERVLPDRPELLLEAAARLALRQGAEEGRPLLLRALALLDGKGLLSPPELHLKAQAHRALGQAVQARAAYQALVRREPRQIRYRCEFAETLYEQGQLREAQRELLAVLAEQPGHARAEALLAAVRRKLTAGP